MTTSLDSAAYGELNTPGPGGISVRGLVKTFAGPQGPIPAVRGVDLDITPGETVALLGPNGAGKSTTIDMLLGLSEPDAGQVSLFGLPPARAVKAGLVGAMLQTGGLIQNLSVRELVTMMASLYPRPLDVAEAMALAGVADDRRVSERTSSRAGQTQRVRFGTWRSSANHRAARA